MECAKKQKCIEKSQLSRADTRGTKRVYVQAANFYVFDTAATQCSERRLPFLGRAFRANRAVKFVFDLQQACVELLEFAGVVPDADALIGFIGRGDCPP